MDYEKLHRDTISKLRQMVSSGKITAEDACGICADFVPESEDERIIKRIIHALHGDVLDMEETTKAIAWLERQGEHLENFDEAEKEKSDFVGDGFIKCFANFLDFKERETYWLEYIGDDKYNVRSDNLLGKTYHITPCQLYTVFKKLTWLEKQGEQKSEEVYNLHNYLYGKQKPADKVEPKLFHEGEWIIFAGNHNSIYQVERIDNYRYYLRHYLGGTLSVHFDNELIKKWTIQDAKDGDILFAKGSYFKEYTFIYSGMTNDNVMSTYCGFDMVHNNFDTKLSRFGRMEDFEAVFPATKEQCDLLFQKMKEAGYEWDAKKKELKKIEQNHADIEIPFGTDSELIEETISIPEGCYAVIEGNEVIIRKGEQKPAWSEEDENRINRLIAYFEDKESFTAEDDIIYANWLKSLKDRVQPQVNVRKLIEKLEWLENTKTTIWSEEDDKKAERIIRLLQEGYDENCIKSSIDWLINRSKSLRPQSQWKPSDAQMASITCAVRKMKESACYDSELVSLFNDLKKLKG